tara:strand:- start:445 stop:609 length:165 start_codon:yes stop_codon:yes gene_type:complete
MESDPNVHFDNSMGDIQVQEIRERKSEFDVDPRKLEHNKLSAMVLSMANNLGNR